MFGRGTATDRALPTLVNVDTSQTSVGSELADIYVVPSSDGGTRAW